MRRPVLGFVVILSACSAAADGGDGPPPIAPDTGRSAQVIVHYPISGHTITVRGSGGSLSWTTGATAASSATDTVTYTVTDLDGPIEWKPLLDDQAWARGPNYHVAPGTTSEIWPHFTTVTGHVATIADNFTSSHVADGRPIYGYFPPSYDENPDATFPVVYMHDGQNLWAALPQLAFSGTWNVDTAFDNAAEHGTCSAGGVTGWGAQPLGGAPALCNGDGDCASGECRTFPEAIVIGIGNTANRINELTPTTDPGTPGGGGADGYLAMVIDDLKPAVDGALRTRPDVDSTIMAGSSLGGLVTAYAGIGHADVFGKLGELSPSSWWNNDVIVGDVAASPASPRPSLVYVDSGQGDVDDESDTDQLAAAYLALGYVDGTTFRHVVEPGAAHNETYWAQRFPGAAQLLLGTR